MRPQTSIIIAAVEAKTGKAAIHSARGWRLVCPVYGNKDRNLSLWEDSERVGLKCYSHQCDPKTIVESVGLTIADVFFAPLSPNQKNQQRKSRRRLEIEAALVHELLLLYKILDKRRCDRILTRDFHYLAENPQYEPMPEEPEEREQIAARRVINGVRGYYGF